MNYKDVLKSVFCENRGYNRKKLYLHQILIAEFCTLNYLYTIILQPNIFVNNEIFYIFACYSKYMNIATTYKLANAYITSNPVPVKESVMWSRLRQGKKKNLFASVRRGVYMPVEIDNKFIIGCNAVQDGVLAYHSALEYYLLQTQEFNEMYIHSTQNFRPFEYLGETYSYKKLKFLNNVVEINDSSGYALRVTSISQTLVDCMYNINLAGGIEELMYALAECPADGIVEEELLHCLELYDNKSLWQRAGFLFSIFQKKLHLSDDFFRKCKRAMGNNQSYIINPYFCNSFDKEWNLCIPDNLQAQIKVL